MRDLTKLAIIVFFVFTAFLIAADLDQPENRHGNIISADEIADLYHMILGDSTFDNININGVIDVGSDSVSIDALLTIADIDADSASIDEFTSVYLVADSVLVDSFLTAEYLVADSAAISYVDADSVFADTLALTGGATIAGDLTVSGAEAGAVAINLYADEGDDNADKWRHAVADGGAYSLENYVYGSWKQFYGLGRKEFVLGEWGLASGFAAFNSDWYEINLNGPATIFAKNGPTNISHPFILLNNVKLDGGIKYATTNMGASSSAQWLEMDPDDGNGGFIFKTAPAGTDGDAITFTTSFEIRQGYAQIAGTESNSAVLNLYADEGDDNSDKWRHSVADGGVYTIETYAGGSWQAAAEFSGDSLSVTDLGVSGTINGVKVYRAIVNLSGTDDPVATVLENSLGGIPVWDRQSNGYYNIDLAGAFSVEKTFVSALAHFDGAEGIGFKVAEVSSARTSNHLELVVAEWGATAPSDPNPEEESEMFIQVEILVYP